MRKIAIHCKYCRKGLKMAYTPTGNENTLVLQGITMTCPYCHNKNPRTMALHNFTEKRFLEKAEGDKYFI
jgi:pyruvate-formate lyase-activating enzyme